MNIRILEAEVYTNIDAYSLVFGWKAAYGFKSEAPSRQIFDYSTNERYNPPAKILS